MTDDIQSHIEEAEQHLQTALSLTDDRHSADLKGRIRDAKRAALEARVAAEHHHP